MATTLTAPDRSRDRDTADALTFVYVGGLLAGDAALLALYRSMAREEARWRTTTS
jgi:hypothetical protein